MLVWNHSFKITESGPGQEMGDTQHVALRVLEAGTFFQGAVQAERHLVGPGVSDALGLWQGGEPLDGRAELQLVETATLQPVDGAVEIGFAQPASSVSLTVLTPARKELP